MVDTVYRGRSGQLLRVKYRADDYVLLEPEYTYERCLEDKSIRLPIRELEQMLASGEMYVLRSEDVLQEDEVARFEVMNICTEAATRHKTLTEAQLRLEQLEHLDPKNRSRYRLVDKLNLVEKGDIKGG